MERKGKVKGGTRCDQPAILGGHAHGVISDLGYDHSRLLAARGDDMD